MSNQNLFDPNRRIFAALIAILMSKTVLEIIWFVFQLGVFCIISGSECVSYVNDVKAIIFLHTIFLNMPGVQFRCKYRCFGKMHILSSKSSISLRFQICAHSIVCYKNIDGISLWILFVNKTLTIHFIHRTVVWPSVFVPCLPRIMLHWPSQQCNSCQNIECIQHLKGIYWSNVARCCTFLSPVRDPISCHILGGHFPKASPLIQFSHHILIFVQSPNVYSHTSLQTSCANNSQRSTTTTTNVIKRKSQRAQLAALNTRTATFK